MSDANTRQSRVDGRPVSVRHKRVAIFFSFLPYFSKCYTGYYFAEFFLFENLRMDIEKIPPLTLGECGLIFDYTPLFGGEVSHSLTPFFFFFTAAKIIQTETNKKFNNRPSPRRFSQVVVVRLGRSLDLLAPWWIAAPVIAKVKVFFPKLSLFFPVLVLKSSNSIGTAKKKNKTNAN